MIINKLLAALHPERFHGWGKDSKHFEGWYNKWITADQKNAVVVIPGVAIDEPGKEHAFIQVLDGISCVSNYYRFSLDNFHSDPKDFSFRIGESEFSSSLFKLDLPDVKGEIHFSAFDKWPGSIFSPGLMGPYTWLPFMEAYHNVISMDHELHGQLNLWGKEIDFSKGRAYMEKEWGRAFPEGYIWMQSNHFGRKGVSFNLCIATVPYMKMNFVGFLSCLYLDGDFIKFTSYNRSRMRQLSKEGDSIYIELSNTKFSLFVEAEKDNATGLLAPPFMGMTDENVVESITSKIKVRLVRNKDQQVLFEDLGENAGLELVGDSDRLFQKWH